MRQGIREAEFQLILNPIRDWNVQQKTEEIKVLSSN